MRQSIIVSRKMENEMMFEDDEVFDSLGQGIHNLLLTNAWSCGLLLARPFIIYLDKSDTRWEGFDTYTP